MEEIKRKRGRPKKVPPLPAAMEVPAPSRIIVPDSGPATLTEAFQSAVIQMRTAFDAVTAQMSEQQKHDFYSRVWPDKPTDAPLRLKTGSLHAPQKNEYRARWIGRRDAMPNKEVVRPRTSDGEIDEFVRDQWQAVTESMYKYLSLPHHAGFYETLRPGQDEPPEGHYLPKTTKAWEDDKAYKEKLKIEEAQNKLKVDMMKFMKKMGIDRREEFAKMIFDEADRELVRGQSQLDQFKT